MKYSNQATLDYAKSINKEECLEDINSIIENEGYAAETPVFSMNLQILNMDCVEAVVAINEGRDRSKSMDSLFVAVDDAGKTELVFIEYRFNYQSLRNMKTETLFDKVSGTTAVLGTPENIHDEHFFVFSSSIKQQAINRFRRLNSKRPQNFVATDIDDIKSIFFE